MEKTQAPPKKKPFKITTQNHPSNTKKWADLPKDVLHIIAYKLDFKTDLTRLRGVCPSWRSALPLADFPLRETHYEVPPLEEDYYNNALVPILGYASKHKNQPLFLLKTRYYLFYPLPNGPTSGAWIARMGELGLNKWRLLSPLRNVGSVENELRYLCTYPQIMGEINLLDHRVVELARPMSLVHDLNYKAQPISKKVVEGARAVLALLEPEFGSGLVLWRLGDHHWIKFKDEENQQGIMVYFKDVEFYNGKFYAFWMTMASMSHFQVWVINPGDLSILKQVIDVPDNFNDCTTSMDANFVQSCGCLYVVIEFKVWDWEDKLYKRKGRRKLVFKLREENDEMLNKWEKVENIGNMTFFNGYNVSFALPPPPRNLALWIPNSIYSFNARGTIRLTRYTDIKLASWNPHSLSEGLEYFDLMFYPSYKDYFKLFIMDEEEEGDNKMSNYEESRRELCTRLFFPPPSWVKWRCPSLDNVEIRLDLL